MRRRSQKSDEEESEINITPMLDVVFILLIFFIVTASFVKESGIDVNRPSAMTAVKKERTSILVAITEDGQIWIDKRIVDPRAVRANIERLHAENPQGGVVIQADKNSKNGLLVQVISVGSVDLAAKRLSCWGWDSARPIRLRVSAGSSRCGHSSPGCVFMLHGFWDVRSHCSTRAIKGVRPSVRHKANIRQGSGTRTDHAAARTSAIRTSRPRHATTAEIRRHSSVEFCAWTCLSRSTDARRDGRPVNAGSWMGEEGLR